MAIPENPPAHSPLPWAVRDRRVVVSDRGAVAECGYMSTVRTRADAQLIVRAVNAHAALVAALREVQSQCAGHADEFSRRVWQIADRALQQVEGT